MQGTHHTASSNRFVLLLLVVVVAAMVSMARSATLSGYADLPNPTANLKTVPSGSLVIPMDLKQYSGGIFNVRAYGTDLVQSSVVANGPKGAQLGICF
jgi:hypothetical protein